MEDHSRSCVPQRSPRRELSGAAAPPSAADSLPSTVEVDNSLPRADGPSVVNQLPTASPPPRCPPNPDWLFAKISDYVSKFDTLVFLVKIRSLSVSLTLSISILDLVPIKPPFDIFEPTPVIRLSWLNGQKVSHVCM